MSEDVTVNDNRAQILIGNPRWIWKYFETFNKVEHPTKITFVRCKVCQLEMNLGKKKSRSKLLVHLTHNHQDVIEVEAASSATTEIFKRDVKKKKLPASICLLERLRCRNNSFSGQTSGKAPSYAQANLVILPKNISFDFLLFCQRNPKSCPLLEVLETGQYLTKLTANNADVRTDLPK